jgi:hypothetical protein
VAGGAGEVGRVGLVLLSRLKCRINAPLGDTRVFCGGSGEGSDDLHLDVEVWVAGGGELGVGERSVRADGARYFAAGDDGQAVTSLPEQHHLPDHDGARQGRLQA